LSLFPFIVSSQSIHEQINEVISNNPSSRAWDLNSYLWSYSKCKLEEKSKRLLDFETMEHWQGLGEYLAVTNDGKYFAYSIVKGNYHNDLFGKFDSLVIQSTEDNTSRWVFSTTKPGFFSPNNEQYVFQTKERTLCFLQLNDNRCQYTDPVASYKVHNKNGWIAWQLKNVVAELVLHNLTTGEEKRISGITEYQFDKSGKWLSCEKNCADGTKELLLVQLFSGVEKRFSGVVNYSMAASGIAMLLNTRKEIDGKVMTELRYINLQEDVAAKNILSTTNRSVAISSISMNALGNQVVFALQDSSNVAKGVSIWYYEEGMDTATVKVTNETNGIPHQFLIQPLVSFTDDDRYIQFILRQNSNSINHQLETVQLEVWSYKDKYIPSAITNNRRNLVKAIIGLNSQTVIPLEKEGRTLYGLHKDFAIVKKLSQETHGDRFWEDGYNEDSIWLVSLISGKHYLIPTKCDGRNNSIWFSPRGKYVVYFDRKRGGQYFSYDLQSKKEHSISASVIPDEFGYVSPNHYNVLSEIPNGIAAWLQNEEGVLVYGQHDIWLLDLAGKNKAINITNGYGRSHNIVFSIFRSERLSLTQDKIPVFKKEDTLLLQSFYTIEKYNGFYFSTMDKARDPKLLFVGPYFYSLIRGCHNLALSNNGHIPIRAKDTSIWLVQRQSATEAPNYFKTTDFKSFVKLTDFNPHAKYNWLTQELHTYQLPDGKYGQGLLYKPANFDSSKKYPVLIIFYQTFSTNLYQFRVPSLNRTVITPGESPIWFLNNGYLVFTPDIYVTPLQYGPTAYNVIEGVVKYLKQLPFVDSNKLGCGSHSWSAKLGAYVFTHSSSFAATAISEGFLYANPVNMALSHRNGVSRLEDVEKRQGYGSLWQSKDLWLDQTTVLHVDKAESPLLLLCNKESSADYQDQTLQFFTALRRLEKKVWWLKYEKGDHTLNDADEMKDFTIRYTQYFDHFLKEAPAPRWMTQGMAARENGIASSYELDPSGSCEISAKNMCSICHKWNEKYLQDPMMFKKPISEWKIEK